MANETNVGPAVATGQGVGPGGNVTGGSMIGAEGDVAKSPATHVSDIKIGPDGEPEPIGNAAQKAAAEAVAATFAPKAKVPAPAQPQAVAPTQAPVAPAQPAAALTPDQMNQVVGNPASDQDAANAAYKAATQGGQTQSTPPVGNAIGVGNAAVQAQGSVQNP